MESKHASPRIFFALILLLAAAVRPMGILSRPSWYDEAFLLPKMRDRYFYLADVFPIILAFFAPQFWFIPLCYQAISALVYSIFLFEAPRSTFLVLATELNTIAIAYLCWKQSRLSKTSD